MTTIEKNSPMVEPIHSYFSAKTKNNFSSPPKHINYNSFIFESQHNRKGRYRLRNCRQPHLKIEEEPEVKMKLSYSDIKEIMRQKIQKESLKKQYDRFCQRIKDRDEADRLRSELFYSTSKIPHKNRFRPYKKSNYQSNIFNVSGKKLRNENQHDEVLGKLYHFPEEPKAETDSFLNYESKYRTKYTCRFVERETKRVQKFEKEETDQPLTGWN